MIQGTALLKLLLIIIVMGLPPFLVALKSFKGLNPILLIVLSIAYWVGTFYTQQVLPFVLIVIIIIKEYIAKKKGGKRYFFGQEGKNFTIKDFFLIVFYTIIIRFPLFALNYIFIFILLTLGIDIQQQEIVDIFLNSQDLLVNIFLFILIVFMAPVNEEFSMRYWLFDRVLSPKTGKILAAILSSMLFTLLHYNVVGIPTFFGLGLFACYIYLKNGFWGTVTVHFTFNLSSILLLVLTKYFMPI